MDAFDNGAVMRWLTMMIVTMLLLIALAPAQPIRSQESPLPTEWIPSPDPCGGMIPNMLPAECHSDHRDYYVFFPTIMRGAPCVCYMPLQISKSCWHWHGLDAQHYRTIGGVSMANKINYVRQGQQMAASLATLADNIGTWRNVFWDRTYNDGGVAELTNADVESLGVTAADVTGLVTFADALDTFMLANRAYLSKMRNDI